MNFIKLVFIAAVVFAAAWGCNTYENIVCTTCTEMAANNGELSISHCGGLADVQAFEYDLQFSTDSIIVVFEITAQDSVYFGNFVVLDTFATYDTLLIDSTYDGVNPVIEQYLSLKDSATVVKKMEGLLELNTEYTFVDTRTYNHKDSVMLINAVTSDTSYKDTTYVSTIHTLQKETLFTEFDTIYASYLVFDDIEYNPVDSNIIYTIKDTVVVDTVTNLPDTYVGEIYRRWVRQKWVCTRDEVDE